MKKLYIPLFIAIAALFSSCNQDLLEIEQKGVTSIESFYGTEEGAEAALAAAYDGFCSNVASRGPAFIYSPYRALFNNCGDDMYAAGSNWGDNDYMAALDEFRYDSGCEVVTNMYKGFYSAIYKCNLVISYFQDGIDGNQTAVTKRCVAEARVLRAWMHMMLAIGWGCPPLVDQLFTADVMPYNCDAEENDNPMTHEQLLEWCAKECEDAVPDLTERSSTGDKDGAVKVTKGFANAVAGKAYLFAGKYNEAKTALKKVIDSGKYALVPGNRFWENFHVEGDCNEEKVFEANFEFNASWGSWSSGGYMYHTTWMEANIWNWRSDHFVLAPQAVYDGGQDGWGGLGVPKDFADEFLANDGPDSYRFNTTLINIEDAVYGMEYGMADIDNMTRAEKEASKEIGIKDVNDGLYGQSFYLPFKQMVRATDANPTWGGNHRLNNYIIMRYAEVLLMYAEACAQTSDASGLQYLQAIQNRAGSKHVSSSLTMDEVKKEKKYEMWLEGCRWADLVRWGDTDKVKQAGQAVPSLYDKLFRAPQAGDQNIIWQHGSEANSRFYTVDTHVAKDKGFEVGFKAGKHERFPYPYDAISNNPHLAQNPQWNDPVAE